MAQRPCLQRRRCFGNAQVTLEKAVLDSVIGANRTGELSRQAFPPSRDRARARTPPTARTRVRARIHTAAALLHTRRQVPPPPASPADGHRSPIALQEAVSMLPALLLDPQPHHKVRACACECACACVHASVEASMRFPRLHESICARTSMQARAPVSAGGSTSGWVTQGTRPLLRSRKQDQPAARHDAPRGRPCRPDGRARRERRRQDARTRAPFAPSCCDVAAHAVFLGSQWPEGIGAVPDRVVAV